VLNPRKIYRLGVYGSFASLLSPPAASFPQKDGGYLPVFMGVSAEFDLKTQLNDALIAFGTIPLAMYQICR
jgi:hypothetical protein